MDESKKQTIIAFVRLLCSLIASAAAMFGFAMDADALFTGAACVLALAAYIWSWWKNNNVTKAATEAQELLGMIKSMKKEGLAADPLDLESAKEEQ